MNPQYPGNQGQMPPTVYGQPPLGHGQRPSGPQNMYNGPNMNPTQPGNFGPLPPKPGQPFAGPHPTQNGPQPGQFPTGAQGDNQLGMNRGQPQMGVRPPVSMPSMGGQGPPRPGFGPPGGPAGQSIPPTKPGGFPPQPMSSGPGMPPPRPVFPPSSQPNMTGPGIPQSRPGMPPPMGQQPTANQLSNQMGSMSLGGPSGPVSSHSGSLPGHPPSSQYGGPPLSNQPMMGQPNHMGPMSGPTGAPPTSFGQYSQSNLNPQSLSGPPTSAYNGPPKSGYDMTPNMNVPPTSGFGSPPGSSYAGPPTSGFSGPPSSNFGPPSGNMGQSQPIPGGMTPPVNYMGGSMPGQGGFPPQQFPGPGQPRMPGPNAMQQPPVKKLDPDSMPSPVQVIEDDKVNRSGPFQTTSRGSVPPLVTTDFITQDQGNCNPSFIRSTMYNIPCTADMMKSSHIPFALSICPFAKLRDEERPPPIINMGDIGPVRCKRCKAYMGPFMTFIDGGRRFQCVFCGAATDVPSEYFNHLDHTGRRVDCYDRPELCLGSYEFVATKDYCKNSLLPKEPAFIFMIDVSYNSVKSGLVDLICDRLKSDILSYLPKEVGAEESEIRVGFVTYAKEIHFYNVKGTLAQPQMLVVSDLEDVFVPLLDGFLVKLSESEAVIDSLLSQIPQMFAESRETETILGPVIQAGLDALKSSERTGKLYVFHSSLPIAEAPGKLKNRDDRKLLGTDKEKTILTPQIPFYTKLGQDCVSEGCSVDLFLFPNSYIDVATVSEVSRLTGGSVYKYSYFQADLDGDRFLDDLRKNVQNQSAFDAILRVRTSTGIRPVDFYGNFYMSNTTDVEMAAINSDDALNVEIKHDDKLSEGDGAYVQVAVLYTSVGGQRRLRLHNLSFNCCTQMSDLFRSCELDTLINFYGKHAAKSILNNNPCQVRESLTNDVAHILACYRKNCASPSSAGQLILPECMKLLPVYANCILKSDGLRGGQEISTDDRSYLMFVMNSMNVKFSNVFFYPRIFPVHNLDTEATDIPVSIRCSAERLNDDGVYLLENGLSMFLWIGHNVDPHWVQNVFDVNSVAQIDIDRTKILELDNPVSIRLRQVINHVRSERSRCMKLTIIRSRDKLEPWFNHFMAEDKGANGSSSYVDFLCHIHKEIRNILN